MTNTVNFNSINLIQFESINKVGDKLISIFSKLLEDKNEITLAISGGNTPKELFIYWHKTYKELGIWNKIKFFWVDERMVPPDHEESNFGVAKNLFFDPMDISANQIFRIKGEKNPTEEAKRYSSVLLENIESKNKTPIFDVILLGIGDDGHTASIFPGNEFLFSVKEICKETENPYTKQKRITITGQVINNAKNIYIIALGSSKKKILQDIFSQKTKKYPIQFVETESKNIELLTDFSLS